MRRRLVVSGAVLAAAAVLALLLVHVCADGGAMGAAYRTCDCRGLEWELYDRMPADGPRRTLCLGFVVSTTCHQFRDGPVTACVE